MEIKLRTNQFGDLLACLAISILSMFIVIEEMYGALYSITIFFTFFIIPGHVLLTIIYPELPEWSDKQVSFSWTNFSRRFTFFEWVIISLSSSLAISSSVAALPLIFDLETGVPDAFSISSITIVMIAISFFRRYSLEEGNRFNILLDFEISSISWSSLSIFKKSAVFFLVSMILMVSIIAIQIVEEGPVESRYSEFYILNSEGLSEDYPQSMGPDDSETVLIGIENLEGLNLNYTIVIKHILYDEDPRANRSIGDKHISEQASSSSLSIQDGQTRQVQFPIGFESEGLWIFKAELTRGEPFLDQEPYREVYLWVSVE